MEIIKPYMPTMTITTFAQMLIQLWKINECTAMNAIALLDVAELKNVGYEISIDAPTLWTGDVLDYIKFIREVKSK